MSLIKKLPTICNRHSSKTINELITIYKQVEESTDENSYFSFGINLKEEKTTSECIFLLATNPRKKLTVSANTLILIAFYGANNV